MKLPYRIELLSKLGEYMLGSDENWLEAKERASRENGWFIPEFVNLACLNITQYFLQKENLEKWANNHSIKDTIENPKTVGIIMAGNIPLVGFHDFLSVFISGHKQIIKLSSKDQVLLKHLVSKLAEWDIEINEQIKFADMLKGLDAYITTGSNNSSRYFEYYFGKYPNIIRKNRTSVAILNGHETNLELERLADDVYQYFGLGCRNVTKLFVPKGYDFVPLLEAFKEYNYLADHHKYKNNYDYSLALHILNKKYYMTNDSILLIEDASLFSPISQLNYEYYDNEASLNQTLQKNENDIQAVCGNGRIPFGEAQKPTLSDFADGVNTLDFLSSLSDNL